MVPAHRAPRVSGPPARGRRARGRQSDRLLPGAPPGRPRPRRHRPPGRLVDPGGQRRHRGDGGLRGRPARPRPGRRRGRSPGRPPVRRVPGDLRVQPRLPRGHRHHLRVVRPPGPAAAPVVGGRPARRPGHRGVAGGPGLRAELRLVCRALDRQGAPLRGPGRPRARPARLRGLHGLPPGPHRPARRLAADRAGRLAQLRVAHLPVPDPRHVPARPPVAHTHRADPLLRHGRRGGRDRPDDPRAPAGPGPPLRLRRGRRRPPSPSRSDSGPASGCWPSP